MLFVDNEESELEKKDNHTWTPKQRPYVSYFSYTYTQSCMRLCRDVSPTSQIRAELRMRTGHLFWTRYQETSDIFDLHGLFSDYWSSDDHQFTVLGQSSSPMTPRMLIETHRRFCDWKV